MPSNEPTLLPTLWVAPLTSVPTEEPTATPYRGKDFCSFEFTNTGGSAVADLKKVGTGCVLVSVDDLDYLPVGKTTEIAMICTVSGTPLTVNVQDLKVGGLEDDISTIIPGPQATCTFYTGTNKDGLSQTYNNVWHPSLTYFHFHDSVLGNDAIKSFYVESTSSVLSLPAECKSK